MISKVIVKGSRLEGNGSFAKTNIPKGELITEFLGERFTRDEIHKRIIEGMERLDDPLQIGDDLFIDIDNNALFINHSCDPNSGIKGENQLYAIRNIEKGEEITFDYSTTVGKNIDWIMDCKCGSNNCRGKIGNIMSVPKERIEYYKKAGVLQDFIREQLQD